MKIYGNIKQGTDEWFEIKWGKVGSKRLGEVMANEAKPVEENAVTDELLGECMEDYEPEESYISYDMQRGIDLEPEADSYFCQVMGLKTFSVGWIECENKFCGISPDRLIHSRPEKLEIKCPGRKKHAAYIRNPELLIKDYTWQIVDYFLVDKNLKKLYVISYRPENLYKKMVLVEVFRDTQIEYKKNKFETVEQLVQKAEIRTGELKQYIDNYINQL